MPPKLIDLPKRPRGLQFDIQPVAGGSFEVQALSQGGVISIFDAIGPDTNTRRIASALRQIGARPVTVEINSPGGDVFEGIGIYNALRAHGHPITVQVLGIAASAASVIAMAGDRVEIAKNAQLMIHNARAGVVGDAATMLEVADILARTDRSMAATYAERTGLSMAQIAALMDAETFMSADEARSLGFADALLKRDALPAPRVSADASPQSKIGLEQRLRASGLSKSIAERIAAAAWPALNREQSPIDLQAVAERFAAQPAALRAAFSCKGKA